MPRAKLLVILLLPIGLIALTNARSQTTGTTTSTAAAPTPGAAEGQRLGTVIKTAITTVAPAIPGILDMIWSHLGNPAAKQAKKTDLQTAANAAGPSVQLAATAQAANAQAGVRGVAKVADELGVIGKFLGPSSTATEYLVVIRTKYGASDTDWGEHRRPPNFSLPFFWSNSHMSSGAP